jgi:hypothetical protein
MKRPGSAALTTGSRLKNNGQRSNARDNWSIQDRMASWAKSIKNKVREITRRHDNLEASVIEKLNPLIRGTANDFATEFSTCVNLFQQVDKWIRMRIRGMKYKRKCPLDNHRLKKRVFIHRPGLLEMLGFTQTTMSLS